MFITPGVSLQSPTFLALYAPSIMTGIIFTPVFFAMWNAPFLKIPNLPSFDLVPSGAIRKDVFSFIIAFSTTFRLDKAFLIFALFIGTIPYDLATCPQSGN